jgi:hypothetical protein
VIPTSETQSTLNNVAHQCFQLFNRKAELVPWTEFKDRFDEEAKKGHIYIQWIGDRITAYLRGDIREIEGEKVFYIAEAASSFDDRLALLTFVKNIIVAQREFFKYVGFFRRKTGASYLIELWLPGNRFSIRKTKGDKSWEKAQEPLSH